LQQQQQQQLLTFSFKYASNKQPDLEKSPHRRKTKDLHTQSTNKGIIDLIGAS